PYLNGQSPITNYPPSNTSTIRDGGNRNQSMSLSVPNLSIPINASIQQQLRPDQEDIRLCTINRSNANETFGIELNYHRQDRFHSLTLIDEQSLAKHAGIRDHDRLIEVNGENIERLDHDYVTNKIRQIRQPNPINQRLQSLELLVCDEPTYNYYKQNNKTIYSGLSTVRRLPPNMPQTYTSMRSDHSQATIIPSYDSNRQNSRQPTPAQQEQLPLVNGYSYNAPTTNQSILNRDGQSMQGTFADDRSIPPFNSIVNDHIPIPTYLPPQRPSLQTRNVGVRKDDGLRNGFGFTFRTSPTESPQAPYSHIITGIDSNAPVSSMGLKINDYILSINDEDVEHLTHEQLEDKLRRITNTENVRLLVADENVYRVYRQQNSLNNNSSFTQNPLEVQHNNVRTYQLQRTPNFEGYGFRVTYRPNALDGGTPHQINQVERNSPADRQGLRKGDYILRVNNQDVEHLNQQEFMDLMKSVTGNNNRIYNPDLLTLDVMDEETYRFIRRTPQQIVGRTPPISTYNLPATSSSMLSDRTPTRVPLLNNNSDYVTTSSPYMNDDIPQEQYPKLRQCHIRPWPHYQQLGFSLTQSDGGYTIHQLRLDSPAAHTGIRNNDHLIEVNNVNIENTSYSHVLNLIDTSYNRDGELNLLVIDDEGYQWYKQNRLKFDPKSPYSNIERKITPETQTVFTSANTLPQRFITQEQLPSQSEIHIPPTTYIAHNSRPSSAGPKMYTPSADGGMYSTHMIPQRIFPDYQQRQPPPSISSTLSNAGRLSRAAVDVVDSKSMLRFCRLNTEPGTPFGFELQQNENRQHVIRNVKRDSPAARAGLHNEDRVIEVNDESVVNKSHKDVSSMIKTSSINGLLRLLIQPSNIKPLSVKTVKSKTKSLPSLTDQTIYNSYDSEYGVGQHTPYANSSYATHYDPTMSHNQYGRTQVPTMVKYLSTSRVDNLGLTDPTQNYRPYSANDFLPTSVYTHPPSVINPYVSQQYAPSNPLPRKCLLIRDPRFPGCGFKLLERENYDTPIVVEVKQNSPAKRSGLAEGDHIIYIDTRNVQAMTSFDEMTQLIHRTFEEQGQITLVTLTSLAYHTLKKKGGYLQPEPFDYQNPISELITIFPPRLCKIQLLGHEQDFGFTLQKINPINIKDVTPGSASYEYGLRPDDRILEINGRDTTTLTSQQIVDIIDNSKRYRSLELLVIDTSGYNWCQMHAIPLNSSLPFVQIPSRRGRFNFFYLVYTPV
ncbi:unnamed protein product, partial [Didymodactylos carnosus]